MRIESVHIELTLIVIEGNVHYIFQVSALYINIISRIYIVFQIIFLSNYGFFLLCFN